MRKFLMPKLLKTNPDQIKLSKSNTTFIQTKLNMYKTKLSMNMNRKLKSIIRLSSDLGDMPDRRKIAENIWNCVLVDLKPKKIDKLVLGSSKTMNER
jgi:hypothetical protein